MELIVESLLRGGKSVRVTETFPSGCVCRLQNRVMGFSEGGRVYLNYRLLSVKPNQRHGLVSWKDAGRCDKFTVSGKWPFLSVFFLVVEEKIKCNISQDRLQSWQKVCPGPQHWEVLCEARLNAGKYANALSLSHLPGYPVEKTHRLKLTET